MAKTLIAFYSRRGENWVDGGVRFLPKGNNEVIVEKIKAQLPEADLTAGVAIHGAAASHCDREVNLILAQTNS